MSFPRQAVFFSERRSKVFTLHTPHFALHSSHSKLQTSHSTLHTPHFTLHSPHFTLLTSHCFLHTPNLTLHSLRPTLHTALNLRGTKNTNATKWRKSADKSLWQPSCSHSNTIYEVELQKTIVLRMQPQHEATLTQPLQCDLRRLSRKTQENYAQWHRKL